MLLRGAVWVVAIEEIYNVYLSVIPKNCILVSCNSG